MFAGEEEHPVNDRAAPGLMSEIARSRVLGRA
jgi:hypothetical protein